MNPLNLFSTCGSLPNLLSLAFVLWQDMESLAAPPPGKPSVFLLGVGVVAASFLIWCLIFAAVLLALYFFARLINKEISPARFVLAASPYFLPASWLYGILFAPHPNLNSMNTEGFVGYWFRARPSDTFFDARYGRAFLILIGFNVLLFLLARATSRRYASASPVANMPALGAFLCWFLSAFFASNVPYFFLDDIVHAGKIESVQTLAFLALCGAICFSFARLLSGFAAAKSASNISRDVADNRTSDDAASSSRIVALKFVAALGLLASSLSLMIYSYPDYEVAQFFEGDKSVLNAQFWISLCAVASYILLWNKNRFGFYGLALLVVINAVLLLAKLGSLLGILGFLPLILIYFLGESFIRKYRDDAGVAHN